VIGAYLLLSGQWKRIAELFNFWGIMLFLAIAAPWYVAVSFRHHQYFGEFFLKQNFERYADTTYGNHKLGPLNVGYLGVLLAGLFPWTIYLPGAIARTFPRAKARGLFAWLRAFDRTNLLLWTAVIVPLAFFCMARTAMPNYILPIFPPLAVILAIPMAAWARSRETDRLFRHGSVGMRVALSVTTLALLAIDILWPCFDYHTLSVDWSKAYAEAGGYFASADAWVIALIAVSVGGLAMMTWCIRANRRGQFVGWAAAWTTAALLFLVMHPMPKIYDQMTLKPLGQAVLARGDADRQPVLCGWGVTRPSFTVYSNALSTLKISSMSKTSDDLAKYMLSEPDVYCLIPGPTPRDSDHPPIEQAIADLNAELAKISNRRVIVVARQDYLAVIHFAP